MDKMDGMTMNIEQANVEKLKEVFPEVFADGKVDYDKLQGLLGRYIADDKEKYNFSWKGKADSLRLAQKRSTGTLRPCKEESKNWDTTQNLYIEGDNLEVLKLLQSSYLNSVKMIYIDPPYNTGNDFVYTDDFADGIVHYKEVTGQATKSNPETAGRYHTNWLNMMYPRLKLARNLLTDDGVIFISIDDHEQANLKKLCDEVFGEDNFVANLIWEKKYSPANDAQWFSDNHDFILVYAKNKNNWHPQLLLRSDAQNDRYTNRDDDPRGVWKPADMTVKTYSANYDYPITTPSGRVVYPAKGRCWNTSKENFEQLVKDNRIWFGENGDNVPSVKKFLTEVKNGVVPLTIWGYEDVGHNQEGRQELKKIFDDKGFFDGPKPVRLLSRILRVADLGRDSIILDFFSGSATTAHAVMQLNAEDGGHRKFICVQLPEKTDEQSEAYKAGYKTICNIGKERIRRAGEKIKADLMESGPSDRKNIQKIKEGAIMAVDAHWEGDPEYKKQAQAMADNLDIGFKVFKLDSSNLVKWDNTPTTDEEEVKKRIQQSLFYLVEGREDLDLVYEIMLKYGLPLTLPVEERKFDNVPAYIINHPDYKVLVCLQPNITLSAVEKMDKETIGTYIFADRCFADANILSNAEEILKKKDKEMRLF